MVGSMCRRKEWSCCCSAPAIALVSSEHRQPPEVDVLEQTTSSTSTSRSRNRSKSATHKQLHPARCVDDVGSGLLAVGGVVATTGG